MSKLPKELIKSIINGKPAESLEEKHIHKINDIVAQIEDMGIEFNEKNFLSSLNEDSKKLDVASMELSGYIEENGFQVIIDQKEKNPVYLFESNKLNLISSIKEDVLGSDLSIGARALNITKSLSESSFPCDKANIESILSKSGSKQDGELLRILAKPDEWDALVKREKEKPNSTYQFGENTLLKSIVNGSPVEKLEDAHIQKITDVIAKMEEIGIDFNEENFLSSIDKGYRDLDVVSMELSGHIKENGFQVIIDQKEKSSVSILENTRLNQMYSIKKDFLIDNSSIGSRALDISNSLNENGFPYTKENVTSILSKSSSKHDGKLLEILNNGGEWDDLVKSEREIQRNKSNKNKSSTQENKNKPW